MEHKIKLMFNAVIRIPKIFIKLKEHIPIFQTKTNHCRIQLF